MTGALFVMENYIRDNKKKKKLKIKKISHLEREYWIESTYELPLISM